MWLYTVNILCDLTFGELHSMAQSGVFHLPASLQKLHIIFILTNFKYDDEIPFFGLFFTSVFWIELN